MAMHFDHSNLHSTDFQCICKQQRNYNILITVFFFQLYFAMLTQQSVSKTIEWFQLFICLKFKKKSKLNSNSIDFDIARRIEKMTLLFQSQIEFIKLSKEIR